MQQIPVGEKIICRDCNGQKYKQGYNRIHDRYCFSDQNEARQRGHLKFRNSICGVDLAFTYLHNDKILISVFSLALTVWIAQKVHSI